MIIEYFGNYWHANPLIYSDDEIVHSDKRADEIQSRDLNRIYVLELMGFKTEVIWESEYLKYPNYITEKLKALDWEVCAI